MQDDSDYYDPEEIMQQLKPDAVILQGRLQPLIDQAVLAATTSIMIAAGDKKMMQKEWQIPTHVKTAIEKSVRQHLHDGLRLMPTSHEAFLPYQNSIPPQTNSDIET